MTALLTTKDVAERLQVTADHVRILITSGRLKAIRISKPDAKRPRYRVTEEDLAAFEAGSSPQSKDQRKRPATTRRRDFVRYV